MKHITKIKMATASAVMALLAACGGGGDGAAPAAEPKFNNAAWSSPAVFVPAEQTSTKLALGRCLLNRDGESPLFNAHLVITSEGNMSITAAESEDASAAVRTFFEMPSDSKLTAWGVSGTVQTPTFYILAGEEDEELQTSKSLLAVMTAAEGSSGLRVDENSGEGGRSSIQCTSVQMPVMHAKLGNARAAQHFGTAAGVTDTYFNPDEPAFIEGGKAFWRNGGNLGGESSDEFRFLRFDMATGELAANATGAEGSTYTPISMTLPQANNGDTVEGLYGEMSCRNSPAFGALAKYILVAFSDDADESKNFAVNAFSYGNVLAPSRRIEECLFGPLETQ